ncbi:MAG: alpha/beta fold hydrolase [Planctomycetes bacterium]|nr:alpha/beta fold hydrolase [Planctomycetota bacterium]
MSGADNMLTSVDSTSEEISVRLSEGYFAYARLWRPRETRGAVLYHHGIQSHCGWYETSAKRLADAGFVVLQIDRRGSGRNEVDRGHAESAEQLIADSHAARDELLKYSECGEYHLAGVSWGGKLAVASHVADPRGVKSLALVTPGLFPKIGVSRGDMAKIGFSMLYEPDKHFPIPLNDPDLFTATPKWHEFFRSDPLTLRECTASFYLASRRMDKIVTKLSNAPPVPVHLFIAGDERIIDNERTVEFIRGLHWPDTQITTFPTARHSLEFEPNCAAYFKELVDFISKQT